MFTTSMVDTPNAVCDAQSADLFWVTGPRVFNREFPHRVVRFSDGQGNAYLTLMAEPVVFDQRGTGTSASASVRIGETIEVDGDHYVVTNRPLQDPTLIRV